MHETNVSQVLDHNTYWGRFINVSWVKYWKSDYNAKQNLISLLHQECFVNLYNLYRLFIEIIFTLL